jgi:threonylcarbamoyladenosine tRNA methylthiotransferase MtaB
VILTGVLNSGAVAIETHGCKLNQADSQALARRFVSAGYRIVSLADGPDIYVLNSCTVTHVADAKARQALRAARRRNPAMTVVATGCYAQRAPEQLKRIAGVDLVMGNFQKSQIVAQVQRFRTVKTVSCAEGVEDAVAQESLGRTRAMVKIQEGCNQVCAYCIVPKVRGRERSIPPDELVKAVDRRVQIGFKEVALTGTQLGSYGFDLPKDGGLRDLVARILVETSVERLRVSSLQPQEITPALLDLWQDSRLCPHFHMPLQSGSDAVLRRMRRRYAAEEYRRTVSRIYEAIPHASVTADVIVGFPGETEEDHRRSLELCMGVDLAGMHVFPYSVRPGTSAAHMGPMTPPRLKQRRKDEMLTMAREKASDYRRRALGSVRPVLWEREVRCGVLGGLTDNYLRVEAPLAASMVNEISRVRLMEVRGDVVMAEAI